MRIISSTTSTDSTQSPLLLTCGLPQTNSTPVDPLYSPISPDLSFSASISSTPQFGFTIEAQRSLLECISSIATVSQQLRSDPPASTQFDADRVTSQVLACLGLLQEQANDSRTSVIDLLFLPRTISPALRSMIWHATSSMHLYTLRTSTCTDRWRKPHQSAFYAQSSGDFSLWPAFVAAVEAYTEEDMASAREWLERSVHFGLGNRFPVKRIIEEVWRRREDLHLQSTIEKGLIIIDWRDVVRDLEVDILLV